MNYQETKINRKRYW